VRARQADPGSVARQFDPRRQPCAVADVGERSDSGAEADGRAMDGEAPEYGGHAFRDPRVGGRLGAVEHPADTVGSPAGAGTSGAFV